MVIVEDAIQDVESARYLLTHASKKVWWLVKDIFIRNLKTTTTAICTQQTCKRETSRRATALKTSVLFCIQNHFEEILCWVSDPTTWRLFPLSWVVSTTDNDGNPAELLIVAGGGSGRRNVYGTLNEIRVINVLNNYETTVMECRSKWITPC